MSSVETRMIGYALEDWDRAAAYWTEAAAKAEAAGNGHLSHVFETRASVYVECARTLRISFAMPLDDLGVAL